MRDGLCRENAELRAEIVRLTAERDELRSHNAELRERLITRANEEPHAAGEKESKWL